MSLRNLRNAVIVMAGFLVIIWALQVVNWTDSYRLDQEFGIISRDPGRLWGIFTAPFLHASWAHIEGNSVPLFVLGIAAAYRGLSRFAVASLIIAVISGLFVWLLQPGQAVTIGASGVIFGYFGYVLGRGILGRNLLDLAVGVVSGLLYWGILAVALPGTPGISWLGHLGGLAGGVLAACLLRTRGPARWSLLGEPGTPATSAGPAASAGPATSAGPARPAGRDGGTRPASSPAEDLLRKIENL